MSSQPRPSLASFWGMLPTEGRWLLSTVAIQTLGRGLTPSLHDHLPQRGASHRARPVRHPDVDVNRPATFTAIFIANAVTMTVPLALLLGPLQHVHGKAAVPAEADSSVPDTYLAILRQPAVAWLTGLSFVAAFVGYGQMEAGFPAFARQISQVSTGTIGIAFAVNTAVIVVLQFWVLGRIAGHRRTRVLTVMTAVWAASWVLLGLTGLAPATVAAVAGVLLFHAVFAFGETMLQPTVPAMANDLAPDHLRGRHNAINSAAFQGGTILGPIAAGILLQHDLDTVYIGMLVAGCLTIAWMSMALERRITPPVNGVAEATATAAVVVSDLADDASSLAPVRRTGDAAGPVPDQV